MEENISVLNSFSQNTDVYREVDKSYIKTNVLRVCVYNICVRAKVVCAMKKCTVNERKNDNFKKKIIFKPLPRVRKHRLENKLLFRLPRPIRRSKIKRAHTYNCGVDLIFIQRRL